MKAPAAAAGVFRPLCKGRARSQPGFALPAQAIFFQGKKIHPELLAAFLKHPVNLFVVFQSKK